MLVSLRVAEDGFRSAASAGDALWFYLWPRKKIQATIQSVRGGAMEG